MKKEGSKSYIYDELRNKASLDFENLVKGDPISYANFMSRRMNYAKTEADIENMLTITYEYSQFDQEKILEFLELMKPRNMFTIIQSQKINF